MYPSGITWPSVSLMGIFFIDSRSSKGRLQSQVAVPCILGLRFAGEKEIGKECQDLKSKSVPSVYEVRRDAFKKILLTIEMMQDHLPSSYLDAINQI